MNEPDDGQQWENEYAQWCEEQEEAERLDSLNRLLRAVSEGTVYDTRSERENV